MAAEAQYFYGNSHHQAMGTLVIAKGFAKEGGWDCEPGSNAAQALLSVWKSLGLCTRLKGWGGSGWIPARCAPNTVPVVTEQPGLVSVLGTSRLWATDVSAAILFVWSWNVSSWNLFETGWVSKTLLFQALGCDLKSPRICVGNSWVLLYAEVRRRAVPGCPGGSGHSGLSCRSQVLPCATVNIESELIISLSGTSLLGKKDY